jgi:hypothetical protein
MDRNSLLSHLKPSFREFILYIMLLILLVIVMNLYHSNSIQLTVNRISRCERSQRSQRDISAVGVYTATAVNKDQIPLFDITYDLKSKVFNSKCRLPKGRVANTFYQQVPVYDFVQKKVVSDKPMTIPICYSNKDYTSAKNGPFTYVGYGPLLDFIESGGALTYMFDNPDGTPESQKCPSISQPAVPIAAQPLILPPSPPTVIRLGPPPVVTIVSPPVVTTGPLATATGSQGGGSGDRS